ncbi:MAG: D-alanyl-D-alanine carboxypeptidase [Peptococcaceae bacterium]|nr:D-alanyl-D-alanine carboxypeptidase [Peptococcaceae bacterium]
MRIKALLMAIVLIFFGPLANSAALSIDASAAIVMDVESGRVLYGNNIHQRRPMASLTKKMTALLAAESGRLDEIITIRPEWIAVEASNIWLIPGEMITLRSLVYGLMLRSGNDAAQTIAYFLAGSLPDFSVQMNNRAQNLGAMNTNFVNPHGLHHPDHFSSAYDLALIARAVLKDPFLRVVVRTERFAVRQDAIEAPRIWHNKNRLLQIKAGADGIKTGWTRAAGHCLASSATYSGWQLLCIVLNSPDHYGETLALLQWGFANFRPHLMVQRGLFKGYVAVVGGQPAYIGVVAAHDYWWVQAKSEESAPLMTVELPTSVRPPLFALQKIGELLIEFNGEIVGRVPLLSDQASRERSWLRFLARHIVSYAKFVLWPLVHIT